MCQKKTGGEQRNVLDVVAAKSKDLAGQSGAVLLHAVDHSDGLLPLHVGGLDGGRLEGRPVEPPIHDIAPTVDSRGVGLEGDDWQRSWCQEDARAADRAAERE